MSFHSCAWAFVRAPRCNIFVALPRAVRALGAALLAASLSGGSAAQTTNSLPPLSLHAALRAAEARSSALQSQDAAARAARELAIAAGRLPDPMLRLSIDNLPTDGPKRYSLTEDFMTQRSVGLTQTLTREDKRRARSARFEREGDAAMAMRSMQLSALRRQTALAWFDRHYRQLVVDLLIRQRDEAALLSAATDAAFRSGRGPQAEVFAARAAVARIDDRIHEARAQYANAGTTLARWVGDAASAPLGTAPSLARMRLAAEALTPQLDRHPDLALMASKEAVAVAEAEIARQDKSADWSVSLMYSQRGPAYSNMVTVGVSVPLQWDQKNRQDRELAAKLAKAEQVRAEREELGRERLAQMQNWLSLWRSNLVRMDDYDKTLIALASERTHAAMAAYRGGKETLAAVVDARRQEIDTRVERLRIEMDTAALWAELEYLMPAATLTEQTVQTEQTP
jgi:outer membrane protein TolC